jgi:hypothetical protein
LACRSDRNEYHMVFALPLRVAQASRLVHREIPFRVLGGSRSGVFLMDSTICQTSTASPA